MAAQSCKQNIAVGIFFLLGALAVIFLWTCSGSYESSKPIAQTKEVSLYSLEKRHWAYDHRLILSPETFSQYCGKSGEFCQFG